MNFMILATSMGITGVNGLMNVDLLGGLVGFYITQLVLNFLKTF